MRGTRGGKVNGRTEGCRKGGGLPPIKGGDPQGLNFLVKQKRNFFTVKDYATAKGKRVQGSNSLCL